MPPSLQGRAKKAARHKTPRCRNVCGLLSVVFLLGCWRWLNKRAAPGVDRIRAWAYGKPLREHVDDVAERVHTERYRATLVRRQDLPKGQGKRRPRGMPAMEDTRLQTAVAQRLEAIYAQDFLPCRYGYRRAVGALDAVRDLTRTRQCGPYGCIVDADIQGVFDTIEHQPLLEMLALRSDEKPLLRLLRTWRKAGVRETEGHVIHPATGTPQGGTVSPILAHVYLHSALDVWFEAVVQAHCEKAAYLWRYADDCVCAFQTTRDAERLYSVLGKRLGRFGRERAAEKTRLLRCSRCRQDGKERGDFLGFTLCWGTNSAGTAQRQRRPSRQKLRSAIANVTAWIKEHRNRRLKDLCKERNAKRRGYDNDSGVRGNDAQLAACFSQADRLLFTWLNRRSQRKSSTGQRFRDLLHHCKIERPRITEKPRGKLAVSCREAACESESLRRARCGSSARRDLCGGGRVTGRPTAMATYSFLGAGSIEAYEPVYSPLPWQMMNGRRASCTQ
ncbi:MAG TPA: reverse transcriptase domain-containing protein [Candidatus Saccharimonadia bacterium]|nr:reverse transcriptase domain-containing protein [Candidatus Saccharimonadia bacterium]